VATEETDHAAEDGQRRALLAAIVESSVDAIASITLDGIVTSWNSGAEAIFGYTAEEMTGRHVSVLYPSDSAEELEPILAQIRRGRGVHHFDTQRVRKDDTVIDVSLSVSPLRGDGGVIGAAGIVRDVTERKWAEAEQRAAEAGRQESARIETAVRLAGGVAAEFSYLLSSIMGYAASAAEATAGDPLVRADVEQIQAAAGRAARLVRELLLFSRREPARPERVDLNAILAGTRDVLQASVGADVELRLITAPYLPTVLADRGQIEQVLVDLAQNARDAMPEGGILTFTTGAADLSEAPSAVWSGTRPHGLCAKLTVSDTGHGMDAETMSRAFEPFFTTKAPGRGTGLGLSAVYGIVTKAGGGIAIDSEEGRGTTVHIYLPAAYVPAQGSAPMSSPGTAPTVLVVDDQPAVLEVVSRILRHNGFHTVEAGGYEEALSLLSAHDPDLLLTDSVLAEVPEQTLADRVREIKPGMRILRMSGGHVTGRKPEGGQVINKPFTAKDLVDKVRAILEVPPQY
jgi:two-component system cell cycle sensor histidine kinase/response regulator CckA